MKKADWIKIGVSLFLALACAYLFILKGPLAQQSELKKQQNEAARVGASAFPTVVPDAETQKSLVVAYPESIDEQQQISDISKIAKNLKISLTPIKIRKKKVDGGMVERTFQFSATGQPRAMVLLAKEINSGAAFSGGQIRVEKPLRVISVFKLKTRSRTKGRAEIVFVMKSKQ